MENNLLIEIDNYLDIEEIKDKHQRVLFRSIRFNLNQNFLKVILHAKATGQSFNISKNLKAQLFQCVLSDGENRRGESQFQSSLTFCTYYESVTWSEKSHPKTIVMRSVISLDGNIFHQIRREILEYEERCLAIASAHYWVLEQLLKQLHIKINLSLNWVPGVIALIIVAITSIIIFIKNMTSMNPLTLLAIILSMLLMWWLLQQGFKRLLLLFSPRIRTGIQNQLFLRLLSGKTRDKLIGKAMLNRFIE